MYREAPELDPAWPAARLASAVLLVWVAVATDVPSVHREAGQRPTEELSAGYLPRPTAAGRHTAYRSGGIARRAKLSMTGSETQHDIVHIQGRMHIGKQSSCLTVETGE